MTVNPVILPDTIDVHSAVSSWSGYEFQGRVAIYAMLSFINNSEDIIKEIDKYFLELCDYKSS